MFKKKKNPDYLKFIIIVLTVLLVSFLALATYSIISLNGKPCASCQAQNTSPVASSSDQLVEDGLVTTVKENAPTLPQIYSDSPLMGDKNAKINMFEFSSFGCHYSAQIQPIIKKILNKYSDQVKLIWKDLPLDENFPGATLAHQAARCAQKQNKFWQYNELLWQNQNDFSDVNLKKLARQLGLNSTDFSSCLKDESVYKIIDKDVAEANDLMIPGTPHFYVGNQELTGIVTEDDFTRVIEAELKRK